LTGLAWFVHETGRDGFSDRFRQVLAALDWTSIQEAARLAGASVNAVSAPEDVRVAG
jgi:hypothetical protein